MDCGHPGNVEHGTVDVSEGTKLDARVHYTCNRGYRINGSVSRICGSDGQWTSRAPTCEGALLTVLGVMRAHIQHHMHYLLITPS